MAVAPAAEQERIVAAIEEQFSRLDAGVAALERIDGHLTSLAETYTHHALAGRWTEHLAFARSADALVTAKRATSTQKRRRSPLTTMRPDAPLPAGWTWASLDDLAANRRNAVKAGPFGSSLKKAYYTTTGYKIYGQEQVIRGDAHYGDYYISEDKYLSLVSCAVRPRDLLISLVGTIGETLILPDDAERGIINPRLIKISLDEDLMSPEFLSVVLGSPKVRASLKQASHGGTMDVINLGMLRNLHLPCPPPEHQVAIVERLAVLDDQLERLRDKLEVSKSYAGALRPAVLASAFTGKLVLQDSNDEPATALLERIAADGASGDHKAVRASKPRAARRSGGHQERDKRRMGIQLMWEDGYSMAEIAETMEMSPTGVGNEIKKMRKDGWDLPSRRRKATA